MYLVLLGIDPELAAATVAPVVLDVLAPGATSGYEIVKRVRARSAERSGWSDALAYPLFHRLERVGYVTSEERTSAAGERRRYYLLTDRGRAALAAQRPQRATAAGERADRGSRPWMRTSGLFDLALAS